MKSSPAPLPALADGPCGNWSADEEAFAADGRHANSGVRPRV